MLSPFFFKTTRSRRSYSTPKSPRPAASSSFIGKKVFCRLADCAKKEVAQFCLASSFMLILKRTLFCKQAKLIFSSKLFFQTYKMSNFTIPSTKISVKLVDGLTKEQLLEFPAFKVTPILSLPPFMSRFKLINIRIGSQLSAPL